MDIRSKLVKHIQERNKDRFRVFDNTGENKKVIAGQFPDLIFMRKEPPPNSDILFVMKVEDGENMLNNISEWQALGSTPSVFYIVVPKSKADEAKKLASATGVRARFALYELEGGEVKGVEYE